MLLLPGPGGRELAVVRTPGTLPEDGSAPDSWILQKEVVRVEVLRCWQEAARLQGVGLYGLEALRMSSGSWLLQLGLQATQGLYNTELQ